jgi:hypothetical protein
MSKHVTKEQRARASLADRVHEREEREQRAATSAKRAHGKSVSEHERAETAMLWERANGDGAAWRDESSRAPLPGVRATGLPLGHVDPTIERVGPTEMWASASALPRDRDHRETPWDVEWIVSAVDAEAHSGRQTTNYGPSE